MSHSLVIMLHGVGSSGGDLSPLGGFWSQTLPDADFVAPDAPHRFGPGFRWFSIDGVTEANRPERVAAARGAFDQIVTGLLASHGMTGRLDRVALVGFSQGAIMALDALATGRWPVAAVVAFSGRLASPLPLHPATATRVLFIHGDADPVMPASGSEQAAAVLAGLGVRTTLRILPGIGHTISSDGAALASAFLAASL
jgi:phospholipase/carboxylesterase